MAEGGIQISIEAHVPYKTYQVRSVSQLWFTPECSAAIAHRNHYFHGYQRSKTTSNLGLFRQARASCKRVPLASKANYASHICHLVSSQRLGTKDFSKSITAFSTSRNPLQLFLSMPMVAFLYHHTPKPNNFVISSLQIH